MKFLTFGLLVIFTVIVCGAEKYLVPPTNYKGAPYAPWAHHHWIWLHNNEHNQMSLTKLYDDYTSRGIPVGAVLVDSQWSSGVNNFLWNRKKYPDHKNFIDYFHNKGVKVVCWVTSMVNLDSSNYKEGYQNNFYLNNGTSVKWWRGIGSFLDYTNPKAVEWWHKQLMKEVLMDKIDGWKTDGIDPVLLQLIIPKGYKGRIGFREYTDMYYRDFYYFTKRIRGDDSLIMARPYEKWGPINYKFAPRDTVVAGWVGDQDGNFGGMKVALMSMFMSAWDNYVNFGSDIGGYRRDSNEPNGRSKQVFIRWTQMGAFNSLMENGGGGQHRPWMFDEETSEIYKKFTYIHMELVPYMLSSGTIAFETNTSVMIPMANRTTAYPDHYDYKFGKDIYISPMVENRDEISINFPKGNDWVDWWNNKVYRGGSTVHGYKVPLTIVPVFKRVGAIIPLNVSSEYGGHGDASSKDYLTMLIQHPKTKESLEFREFKNTGFYFKYEIIDNQMKIIRSAHETPMIILIKGENFNEKLSISGLNEFRSLEEFKSNQIDGFYHSKTEIWIKVKDSKRGFIQKIGNIYSSQ
eukprot:gene2516-3222_t